MGVKLIAPWRTKKLGVLLLLLIHQSVFANTDVATLEDYNEFDDPALYELDGSGSNSTELDDAIAIDDFTGLISVSYNCRDYGIDNLPHPRIILLGPTGVGKSTLANQLLGRNPLKEKERIFSVGHGVDSHTIEITYVIGNWLGDGPCFTIIDTPGTSDSEGRDYEHASAMATIMKDQIKSVDVFLLCFNGMAPRFDQPTIDLLKLYESIFSKEMWNHAMTEVTYWAHDRSSVRKRRRQRGMTEKKRHKEWNSQYKQELGVTIDIPSVYIDPMLEIFDSEEKEFLEERAIEAFEKYTNQLFEFSNNSEPFFCDGNCKAPNGYFLGNPWIETSNITEREGEKAEILCQIWNGIQGKASKNVTWTHNGEIIYEKTMNKNQTFINRTDVWGSNVKFVEILSPGKGHFTDFIIKFESLEESMEGQYVCENGLDTNDNIAEVSMIADGSWKEWGPWGKCSISCFNDQMGSKKRIREAILPRNGGKPLNPLDGEEIQICAGEKGPQNPIWCPKDFSWNEWTQWSECSRECSDGISYRVRSCNQGYHGGKMCPLSAGINLSQREEKSCKIKDCPKCIQTFEWQEWSQCSKTCMITEPGTMNRTRKTKEADPKDPQCNPDDHFQQKTCNTNPCPKDFTWNVWTEWSECSPRCGDGTKYRMRSCNQGSHGGKECPLSIGNNLSQKEEMVCKIKDCPNCILLGWQEWSECSKTCMGNQAGTRTRQRSTQEADPNNARCRSDDHSQREMCNIFPCPVHGGWTPWSSYGPCSASCGSPSPIQIRRRFCTEPAPLHGGKTCVGPREETRNCNTKLCPVDGRWASWASWSTCSATCGSPSPTQTRTRSCTSPEAKYGGRDCPGWNIESRSCNAIPCPVNGGWTPWSSYGFCSATCGPSTQMRKRSCTQPAPLYGGNLCSGLREESRSCKKNLCPVDGKWESWSSWSSCSATCGFASPTQIRTRSCTKPLHGGKYCPGSSRESRNCNHRPCPVDGSWTPWSSYGLCSDTCGSSSQIRTRYCNQPQHGGKQCSGLGEEYRSCNKNHCPIDGRWTTWSSYGSCSATCGYSGDSIKKRTRSCSAPAAQYGGEECLGSNEENKQCNVPRCPVDGGLTEWSNWSPCSATCGAVSPTKSRIRTCTAPKPQFGGKECLEPLEERKNCNDHPCHYEETAHIYLDGGYWGSWGSKYTCTFPAFVTGMELRIESNQGDGDDTALNAIILTCSDGREISSSGKGWGSWRGKKSCSSGHYIKKAKIRRESNQGGGDDTSANGIRFKCTDGGLHYPGDGLWGSYGDYDYCLSGSAVMGIKTQVESCSDCDDTAINDVKLYCAKLITLDS